MQGYDGELRARAYLVSFFTGLRRQELGSLTPRSFRLDDDQPTLTVEAACSKHRRKDTLPMHPELVSMVREWVRDLGPDDLLFPRIERKKTWLDGEEGSGAGRHPLRDAGGHRRLPCRRPALPHHRAAPDGASIMEAKELARHADIRQTVKYTHIGMEDRAEALAGLPSPKVSAPVDCLQYVCVSGGVLGQEVSPDVSDDDRRRRGLETNKPRRSRGLRRLLSQTVTRCQFA